MKEQNDKVMHISDYEWASACQYIVWVSTQIGIKDVSASDVFSFPVSRYGPKLLIARKVRTQALLQENMDAILDWVHEYKQELTQDEMNIVRGIWRSMLDSKELVAEQIERIQKIVDTQEVEYMDLGGNEDEFPF